MTGGEQIDDDIVALTAETTQSAIRVAFAARQRVLLDDKPVKAERLWSPSDGYLGQDITLTLHEGERHTIEKVVALYTSRDRAISEPGGAARDKVRRRAGPARPARPARAGLGSPVGALRPADQRA